MIKFKKIAVPVLLFGVLVLVGLGCGGGKYSTPKRTAKAMVEATKSGDVEGYLSCLTDESREWLENLYKMTPEGSLTSENLKSQEISYNPEELVIIDEEKNRVVLSTEGESTGLVLIKEKGNWKVDLLATMEEVFQGNEK